ncbi:hypothetical protein [Acidicapsa dinghuensis]|uniref:hypothetical protein n=1 Tax=Acidicapsa dinghuensis TaxID=2218256 RepID=UPI00366ACCED
MLRTNLDPGTGRMSGSSNLISRIFVILVWLGYLEFTVRFREKINQSMWRAIAFWGVFLALQFLPSKSFIAKAGVITFLLVSVAAIEADRFIYWELGPQCLLIRKLWKKKEIPWDDVTNVGWLGNMSGTFCISVGHCVENYDRLYIEPSNSPEFVAALRKFGPHINFELERVGFIDGTAGNA